jgi:hypothetical protein
MSAAQEPVKEPKDKGITIVVNGTEHGIDDDVVSYEQVVALGFPNRQPDIEYSVVYSKAKVPAGGSGSLVPGRSVTVKKKGTSFDVTATTRS